MKIAQIVSTFPPYKGGIGNVAYNYSKQLAGLGHKVFVFTPKYRKVNFKEQNFKIIRLNTILKFGNAALLPQLFFKLKNFDIVHLHYPFFGSAGIVWLLKKIRGKKMKLVVSYHMDVVGKGFLGRFFKFHNKYIMPLIIKSADRIICASFDYIRESNIKDIFEKFREKFVEISFGVDLDIFQPRRKDVGLVRKYNLGQDDKLILFVGGLDKAHYFKGVDYLIKAVKSLDKKNIKLLIIGKGELVEKYKFLAQSLDIEKQIIFEDETDYENLAKFYNLADLFVLPSIDRSEAFGLVLLEAMACAKPVIASNLPGVRSVVGSSGLVAEPKDTKSLVEKIKNLLDNKNKAEQLGRSGRRRTEEIYNWPKGAEKLNQVYENMLNF